MTGVLLAGYNDTLFVREIKFAMKALLLLAVVTVGQCALLGSRKCTYGPSYWCSHVDHARECQTMQHCMSTVWKNQLQGVTGTMENCFDVIRTLDDVRHAPNPLDKMAESCTRMTAEKRSVCKELMRNNPNEVLLLLQSDLPSVNVATALGLCGGSSDSGLQPHVEHKQGMAKSGNYCSDCLKFFGDVQEIINNTEGKIAQKLKGKVCIHLGYFEKLCNETVDTYVGFAFTILAQQLNPEDVCFLFQLCASKTHHRDGLLRKVRGMVAKAHLGSVECDMCQDVAKEVQNALRDTTFQNDILSALENKVCPLLPGNLSTECKSYVSQYGPLVFQVLVAELDPSTICQSLGLCNGTKTEEKPALVSVPLRSAVTTVRLLSPEQEDQAQFSPVCSLCTYVVRELDSMISSNATEEEIVEGMEKVCSYLPDDIAAQCKQLVDTYGRTIVELLLKDVGPEAVCTLLGLCAGDQPAHVDHPVAVKSGEGCTVCKTVMGYIRDYLQNPEHAKTIEQLMDQVCDLVPPSYRAECVDIVNTYAPLLISTLEKYVDPVKVCTKLSLCNGTKTGSSASGPAGKPLLFVPMAELQPAMPVVPCSQGPHIWCASVHNARVCNAMQYCVENQQLKLDG